MTVVAATISRPPRVYGRSASISSLSSGGTSGPLRRPVAHPPLLLTPAKLTASLSGGATFDDDPSVHWTSPIIGIAIDTLCQAISVASPIREVHREQAKLLSQNLHPHPPAAGLSATLSTEESSPVSSTRSSPLPSLDSPLTSQAPTAVATPQDPTRPLGKTARIDPAPATVLPLLPVRPTRQGLPPLPPFFYFYPLASAAAAPARARPGSRSRASTPALADERDDGAAALLAPSDTPCVLCRKDGVPCIPPRGTRRGQGCCVLCRATGSRCERAPPGAKRGRDSTPGDDAAERPAKRARR